MRASVWSTCASGADDDSRSRLDECVGAIEELGDAADRLLEARRFHTRYFAALGERFRVVPSGAQIEIGLAKEADLGNRGARVGADGRLAANAEADDDARRVRGSNPAR